MTTKASKPGKIKCDQPECTATFNDPRGLGTHRRIVHGIAGSSRSVLQYKKAKARKAKGASAAKHWRNGNEAIALPCEHCHFVASWKGGLTYHMKKKHPELTASPKTKKENSLVKRTTKTITLNGQAHEENGQDHPNAIEPISETVLAIALGRFQGLCTEMASFYDIPPRMFASRFSELIYRSQVR